MPYHFYFMGIFRHGDKISPNHQTWCKHGGNTNGRKNSKPDFQLVIFRLINGLAIFVIAVFVDAISHKAINNHKNKSCNPECDQDGVINRAPVGGNISEPPGTPEVKAN